MSKLDIHSILSLPASFTLLVAPPAWGKTRLLHSLFEESFNKLVFISPLKALALEFCTGFSDGESFTPESREVVSDVLKKFDRRHRAVLSITPELCTVDFYKFLETRDDVLVVFDEFHLFYYWGDTFRPMLLEVFMGVASQDNPILTLTATVSEEMIDRIKFDLVNVREISYIINLGNQKLKTVPLKTHHYTNTVRRFKAAFYRRFMYELEEQNGVVLLFCRYRYQVDRWVQILNSRGVDTLGCKGGEVKSFIAKLDIKNPPRCIVATSTLGHGVNLPSISKIFISYKVRNIDFWVQMVGRGGRNGEDYQLFTFDYYGKDYFNRGLGIFKSLIFDLHLSFRSFLMG